MNVLYARVRLYLFAAEHGTSSNRNAGMCGASHWQWWDVWDEWNIPVQWRYDEDVVKC